MPFCVDLLVWFLDLVEFSFLAVMKSTALLKPVIATALSGFLRPDFFQVLSFFVIAAMLVPLGPDLSGSSRYAIYWRKWAKRHYDGDYS